MTSILTEPFTPSQTAGPNGRTAPPPEIRAEVITVTPELAREWTALNTRNRNVRYGKVAQQARDMKAGTWALNGESVKIAVDGTILDGQHRLYACIQAEVPFTTFVVRGLPLEAQDTIDTGTARRMADQLAIRDEPNANIMAAIARQAYRWIHGIRMTGGTDKEATHSELLALMEAEPRIREATTWAVRARNAFRPVNASTWGMAWLLFHGTDYLTAEVFLEKVITGADIGLTHPAMAFRNRMTKARDNGERLNQYEQLGYLIMAWNAFKEGRTLGKLLPPRGGFTAKTFPEPR